MSQDSTKSTQGPTGGPTDNLNSIRRFEPTDLPEPGVKRFTGKVAIVTGATSGIGQTTAEMFALEGASVVVTGRRKDEGERVVAAIAGRGGSASYVQADLTVPDECVGIVRHAHETYGRVDVLVNNAGWFPRADILTTTVEVWDRIFAINVRAPFILTQAAVPIMQELGGGSIVNVGSINQFIGGAELMAYASSKGALATLTKNLARSIAKYGIRVNLVNPGWILTTGEYALRCSLGEPENWPELAAARMPFRDLLGPLDIAKAILFLASDDSRLTSGATLTVDQVPHA